VSNTNKKIVQLQTILKATALLNSRNDVQSILDSVMNTTLELLERADIGVIFLYDENEKILKIKSSIGFGNVDMKLKPGESITGVAFSRKETVYLKNHKEIAKMMSIMAPEKRLKLNNSVDKSLDTLQSSIACPLIHDKKCIGVFVIDNYETKEPLTKEDVYLAELMSLHATIAITNASNHEKLKLYSRMIEKDKDKCKYSIQLNNKFTEMVLNGVDINGILKEVSTMLKKDMFTINLFNTISYSSLGVSVTYDMLLKEQYKLFSKVLSKKEIIFYCENFKSWIFLKPVKVNQEILGWLGIISDTPKYTESEKIIVDNCSTIITLEILIENELSNMEQALKGNFLDNLLKDDQSEFTKKLAKKYNYKFNTNHQIIICKIDSITTNKFLNNKYIYLYKEINKITSKFLLKSVIFQKKNMFIIIYDTDKDLKKETILKLIHEIFDSCKFILPHSKNPYTCKIIVSEIIKDNKNFKLAYENTMQLFTLERKRKDIYQYYFYEDLEIKKFLLKNDKENLDEFVIKVLGPLIEYHNSSKVDLFITLKTYIISGGNWTLTKNKLYIHGNTLTYRLNRLEEILDIKLSDYQERFRIQIALEIITLNNDFKI